MWRTSSGRDFDQSVLEFGWLAREFGRSVRDFSRLAREFDRSVLEFGRLGRDYIKVPKFGIIYDVEIGYRRFLPS